MAEQFWNRWLDSAQQYGQAVGDRIEYLRDLPNKASDIAEERFPGYDRDASTKNAFRHALGTGMLAQELGSSWGNSYPAKLAGAAAAKMVGHVWEMPTWMNPGASKAQLEDSRHDLNANHIGAVEAMSAASQEELITALDYLARNSRKEKPGIAFAPSPGYMTRTGRQAKQGMGPLSKR